jgi:hypothetical protein
MKKLIVGACAVALLAGCGVSKDANAAFAAMNIGDGKSGTIKYATKSGSGDRITLKDVIISETAGQGLKASQMVLSGLDMGADGKPLVREITIRDIAPETAEPGLTMLIKTMSVESRSDVTSAYLARLFGPEGPGEAPPFEQWDLERMTLEGLTLKGDLAAMEAGTSGAFNVTLDEISVRDLKNTVFGKAKLAGLKGDFDVPAEAGAGFPIKGAFDFGEMDLTGLQGKLFADAFMAGMESATTGGADGALIEPDVFGSLSSPIDPGYTTARWTPMFIEASGARLDISGGEGQVTRNGEGVATKSTSSRASLKFTTNAANGSLGQMAGAGLSMVGYESLELYGQADATYDPATDTTRYTRYNFGLTDGFDINLTGGFQGLTQAIKAVMAAGSAAPTYDAETGEMTPANPDLSGLEVFKVVDFDMTLVDKSLVNRLLGLSSMTGSDPETMRADIVAQVRALGADLSGAGVDPAVANEFMTALANFVERPGTLRITMKPAQPVALAKEGQTLDKAALGLSITHTPATAPEPTPPGR